MSKHDYPIFFFSGHLVRYLLFAFAGVVITAALFLWAMAHTVTLTFDGIRIDPAVRSHRSETVEQTATSQVARLGEESIDHSLLRLKIGEQHLQVEVVTKPESISQGLSGRQELGSDGMLFVLPVRQRPTFWMKDMRFPLDFVWIDQGHVREVTLAAPAPGPDASLADLPRFRPREEIEWVLEMEAGQVQALGIAVGDQVEFVELE